MRSVWKPPFLDISLSQCKNITTQNILHIWSRRSIIPACLLDYTVRVYNGKLFKKLRITREKIGFKFGMFITTRNKPILKKSKTSKKNS